MEKTDIKKLPTIIELIDSLSYPMINKLQYWEHIPPQLASIFGYTPEGKYVLHMMNGKLSLLPSGFRAGFFRGQNTYFETSKPSLFRNQDEKDILIDWLKRDEFFDLLASHPIIKSLDEENIFIDKMALAQHYGFWTNLMDLTSDIWAAAFFATTKYDLVSDSYSPVETSFGKGYGILYVSKGYKDDHPKISPLGFNFLPRPYKQMGSTYAMSKEENFNDEDYFQKHLFRHDTMASQWVFEMSYKQRKYFPKDIIADKANEIKKSMIIYEKSIDNYIAFGNNTKDDIINICKSKGYSISKQPPVCFDELYIDNISKEWNNNGGVKSITNNVLPFMMKL